MGFSSDPALQTNQLPLSIDFPYDQLGLVERLTLAYKQIVDAMNTKEGALYLPLEIATFIQYFPDAASTNTYQSLTLRPVYRMTYDLVALNGGPIVPGTTTIVIPANQIIKGILIPTRLDGAATAAGPQYVALPSRNIDVIFDNTVPAAQTIIVKNNFGSNLTQAYFTIEYLKE